MAPFRLFSLRTACELGLSAAGSVVVTVGTVGAGVYLKHYWQHAPPGSSLSYWQHYWWAEREPAGDRESKRKKTTLSLPLPVSKRQILASDLPHADS